MAPRNRFLSLAALCAATAMLGLAQAKVPAMSSSVFDWNAIVEKATRTGSTRNFFQASTAQLGEVECHVTTLNPGLDPHPPHQHPEEELYVIKEGTVEVVVNGERKQVGAGSVVFAAANQPHGIRNAGTTPASYHVIKWRVTDAAEKNPRESAGEKATAREVGQ